MYDDLSEFARDFLQQGREEGREEVAVNMLRSGWPLEQIAAMTKLPFKLIKQLQARLQS